jgi:transcriptional regulator with XRE-family HTH domain
MRHGDLAANRDAGGMDVERLVGLNFKRLREEQGLSQETAAHNLGTDQAYISQFEKGKRNPTIRTLYRLAIAIGAKPGDLYSTDGIDPEVIGDPDTVVVPKSNHGKLTR